MSISLDLGTIPEGLEAKTYDASMVRLGRYEISMVDFCILVRYVMTNTDIEHSDEREKLVEFFSFLKKVPGYSPGEERFSL